MRRNFIYKKYAALLILLGSVLIFSPDLYSQIPNKNILGMPDSQSSTFTEKADSTSAGSIDSTKTQQDSIVYCTPFVRHGSVSIFDSSAYRKISKYDFRFKDYNGLYDIIKDEVPASRLPLGNYGQFDHFSFFGGTPRDVSFTFNNRPINDLEYGTFNMARFPVEFLESVEIFTGSDAVIFSDNSSGALINIQEIKYNSAVPYTRFWFTDGGGNADHLGVDGIFSQNFAPNWNFTFGFKTQSSDGQFKNSFLDSWNVRGVLRWNPSNRTSISFVHNYVKHYVGLNGGIDPTKSINDLGQQVIYDEVYSVPLFTALNEKVFRHNATLSISSILDKDSSAAVSGSLFLSTSERSLNRGYQTTGDTDTNSVVRNYSNYFGANGKYEQKIFDIFALKVGGNIMINDLEETVYHSIGESWAGAAFGHLTFSPIDNIVVSGGMRLKQSDIYTSVSSGAKAKLKFTKNLSLIGDLSISERTPSPSELTENDRVAPEKELNTLALSEIVWKDGNQIGRFGAFARYSVDPILSAGIYDSQELLINTYSFSGETRDALGLNFSYSDKFIDRIGLKVWGQVNLSRTDGADDDRLPLFYGGAESFYEFRRGSSILRVGARTAFSSAMSSEQYVPLTGSYINSNQSRGALLHGVDIFVRAKLGNVFLRLTYENLLNNFMLQNYWQTSLYPMHGSNFRMTVSWAFVD